MVSRTSRLLLVIAVLALAAFVLVELPRRRAEERAALVETRLADFDPALVDGVTIVRPADTLSFALQHAAWRMTAPVADLAEPSSVLSLLHALHTASRDRDLGAGGDERRYGLDPPAARIIVTAASDTVLCLDLGAFTVDRAWVYARVATGHVVLVPTDLYRAASAPADDYRNRRVVAFDRAVVREFRVRATDSPMNWVRAGVGWSTVVGADTVAGDSVAVESMLRRLRGMRVGAFVAAADTARAFERPAGILTLIKSNGTPPVTVRFARRDSVFWARNDGETRVVEVEGDVDGLLAQTVTTLRDRRLLPFAPARATRIEIAASDTSGVLVYAGGAWAHPNPALGPVEPARVADFFRAMRVLQWTELAPAGEPVPSGHPGFSLVVYGSGGTILSEFEAWPRPSGSGAWIARAPSAGGLCLVDPASLARLADLFRSLRSRPATRRRRRPRDRRPRPAVDGTP